MFPLGQDASQFQNDTYSNIPNMSLMYMMYTPTFGNMNFFIQPPIPGKVGNGFPSVPYVPLEGLIYMNQAQNQQVMANDILTGTTVGSQSTGGTSTTADISGTPRYMLGYQGGQGVVGNG